MSKSTFATDGVPPHIKLSNVKPGFFAIIEDDRTTLRIEYDLSQRERWPPIFDFMYDETGDTGLLCTGIVWALYQDGNGIRAVPLLDVSMAPEASATVVTPVPDYCTIKTQPLAPPFDPSPS